MTAPANANTKQEERLGLNSANSPTASAEFNGNPPAPRLSVRPPARGADSSQRRGRPAQAEVDMLERMDRNYRDLLVETEGHASMDALLALVDSLGTLPGRKTVVYLCEGLTIPPSVESRFRSVIDTANRRNVSLYAMDAAGLRAHSAQADIQDQLDTLTKSTVAGVERSNNGKWSEDLENNETLLKSDPAAALGILTSQTGGILIQGTNDPEKAIQRIDEDRRFHYLLGYTSSNPSLDGSYRHIEVKLKRGARSTCAPWLCGRARRYGRADHRV